jgi:hypothetical protein
MPDIVDIAPMLQACNDPALIARVATCSAVATRLALRDSRYWLFSHSLEVLFCELVKRRPVSIRHAANAVLDEINRLEARH